MKKKLLIFLIPFLYVLNYPLLFFLFPIIYDPLALPVWGVLAVALAIFPIISAFVFYDDKLWVWIAPFAGSFAVLWPYIFNLGVDQVAQFSLYAAALYLPYSLICTVVAVFVRNREKKERGILDEKNR